MARILACVDGSSYANSVCDHAGWFASDPEIGVEVLNVVQRPANSPSLAAASENLGLVERAVSRLQEEGVGPVTSAQPTGSFVDVASRRGAQVIVMGKRGDGSQFERHRLGSNVETMVRATSAPICLTSRLFLPIRRGLVVLDADMAHRDAVEFALGEPRFVDLPMDIVVVHGAGDDPAPKVELARDAFNSSGQRVFTIEAAGLNDAVTRHMEARSADLIVVSRPVIARDPGASLSLIDGQGVWGARTPVLIC